MKFAILGPVEVTAGGRPLDVGGARARAVLATLIVHANHVVSADQLIEELWPGRPADKAAASLQVRLSGLRKLLRSAADAQDRDDRLITQPPGYRLRVTPAELDSRRFGELAAKATEALAAGGAAAALDHLDEALSLWRGPALAGIDAPSARAEAARLEELRLAAIESRADALLRLGRLADLVAELETLTKACPLRERLWYQRMLALYRSGRQADALRAYLDVRATLAAELGIEPGPLLRDLHARILRQDPDLDPPAPARDRPVMSVPGDVPTTRYARTPDGVHIAYQVLGQGGRDIVFVPGLMSHLDLLWEEPDTAGFFRRLASLGRLILFDKRDTGLSDRAVGDSTLEERMGDVLTVMRAAGSRRAVLFGYSEGAPMSILFTATYPERVSALVLGSAAARWSPAPDYPCGQDVPPLIEAMSDIAANRWGQGETIEWYLPSRSASPHARELFGRFERLAVTPGAFLRMLAMIREIDVRAALPAIRVPTLVIHRLGDRITSPCHGRYLAAHIDGARYFEQPGDHSLRFAGSGDSDALFGEIADFLTASKAAAREAPDGEPGRVLATILHARTPPSEAVARLVAGLVARHGGQLLASPGEAVLATFSTPGQAIRCARALGFAGPASAAGCGIHTGEVALAGDSVEGAAVRIAAGVAGLSRPGEIVVSRTVRDLLAGAGYAFTDRGSHRLGDSAEPWQLFAVAPEPRFSC
jgi:DNA-binding SARP family transcriptional activator/pimeloyl-ACP methyl ester carboxylesterase